MKLKWEVYVEGNLIGETEGFNLLEASAEPRHITEQRIGFVRKYAEENNWRPSANSINYKLVRAS